ncbi:MAG: glycine cleavage system aminomethyltransferase GcvT [Dongiaceae bacterium]
MPAWTTRFLSEDVPLTDSSQPLKRTPLHALHVVLGAKMVPFAGYDMPVQYPMGILAEHQHTRAAAGLFDVSHMGQVRLTGSGGASAAKALEALVPADVQALTPGQMRYTQFTNEAGGILDDLMVANTGDHLMLVVNAAGKDADAAHLRRHLAGSCRIEELSTRGLLALQGPKAAEVLERFAPQCRAMTFMTAAFLTVDGVTCYVTRSGYTGEDGYEISMPGDAADRLARRLLQEPEVKPVGLGARDSLRLEAGLCLHGNDIDAGTTPVEAALTWSIGKRRRGEGGFIGADVILKQLKEGAPRRLVGIRPEGRAPARAHAEIRDAGGRRIGEVTSGGFGPTVNGPVAMGYVAAGSAAPGTDLQVVVRDKALPAKVAPLPFVPHRYHRG